MSKATRAPQYNIGDIVYLVSGGPAMAVGEAIINGYNEFSGDYWCQWFSGRKHEKARFPEESLTTTNPKP